MSDPTGLETFFAYAWKSFLLGDGIEGPELEDAIANSGLAIWRDATPADVEAMDCIEEGYQVLALTDEGKAAIRAVSKAETT